MKGLACRCPRCGAPNRVSIYVLESAAREHAHRCLTCGWASALADWQGQQAGGAIGLSDAKRIGSR